MALGQIDYHLFEPWHPLEQHPVPRGQRVPRRLGQEPRAPVCCVPDRRPGALAPRPSAPRRAVSCRRAVLVLRRRLRARAGGCCASTTSRVRACRWSFTTTARCSSTRRTRTSWAAGHPHEHRSATPAMWSSSALGRPAWRPRSTPPRKDSARWSWSRTCTGGQAGHEFTDPQLPRLPARPQRATSSPTGPRAGLAVRRELRARPGRGADRQGREADRVALADGSEVAARAVIIASGVAWRRLGSPAPRGAGRRRRLLRRGRRGGARDGGPRRRVSSAPATPPVRPPSTWPGTRRRSRWSCAATACAPACPSTWSPRSRRTASIGVRTGTEVIDGGGGGQPARP